ncbi:DNA-directed RNA polymerase III subunit RPC6 [Rhynchospora pubera]|uniref:DNA-directed RNA polymerase III subunit RPC6 n=1 Tax=Rhynchospora pubera TaxID=906938 RepID=A0AAV8EVI8_9POAL|nr:DNA-directed RNA polymerase III subunit RPC6 [Rhynchospora pubera]
MQLRFPSLAQVASLLFFSSSFDDERNQSHGSHSRSQRSLVKRRNMSGPDLSRKRPRPDASSRPTTGAPAPALAERDKILELIRSRANRGIWSADVKRETNIPQTIVQKQIKILLGNKLIKEVTDIRYKSRKVYMAAEFEPSDEISGGTWFSGGSLNKEVISDVRKRCKQQIMMLKAATSDMIYKGMKKLDPNLMYTMQQIGDILQSLVIDKEVDEIKSTGKGDFANVPAGKVCYRIVQSSCRTQVGALASIPCGVCPRLRDCTPHGEISPRNCEYYKQWLGGEYF